MFWKRMSFLQKTMKQTTLPPFYSTQSFTPKHLKAVMVPKESMISALQALKFELFIPSRSCWDLLKPCVLSSDSIWPLGSSHVHYWPRLLLAGSWLGQMCLFLFMPHVVSEHTLKQWDLGISGWPSLFELLALLCQNSLYIFKVNC